MWKGTGLGNSLYPKQRTTVGANWGRVEKKQAAKTGAALVKSPSKPLA
jgi:hypothetical protein